MDSKNSIRTKLSNYMSSNNVILSHFADKAGINSGTLSRIIQGNKTISMNQLIAITLGMGLPEDYFFEDYIDECFSLIISIRRIRPFIVRCVELNRLDCVEQVVSRLLDDLSYVPVLFELAEELFHNNYHTAAGILYKSVRETEKYQHSERLALCHYRLFVIDLGEDLEENVRAAAQFELYVYRLDEADQLEALKQLMHVYRMVHKWAKVDAVAKELHRIATIQYNLQQKSERKDSEVKRTERPIYYYILYAYLARSTACEECGDYKRALEFVTLYGSGHNWIEENDEEAKQIIEQFSEWAVANTYLYRLMSGDVGVLNEYADYVSYREEEIFVAVRHIVQAANFYRLNVDNILDRFAPYIPYQSDKKDFGEYKPAIMKESYAQFLGELAVYRFNEGKDDISAIKILLEGLDISIKINSSKNIITCMSLFEQHRDCANLEQREKFKKLSSEVYQLNAKKNNILLDAL
ncbi:helix-turn-helix domain-containing protein [Paenibacillus taichungensis]|nr:helix-turn-helix transcriptional regulator [Paenibacillus taichungensis]